MSDTATTTTRRRRATAPPTAPAPPAPRLPAVQRQRRLGLAALATLLIVGFGALAGALVLRSGDRVGVVAVAREVPAGQVLVQADLTTTDVAVSGISTVPASGLAEQVGRVARVPLLPGTLLAQDATTLDPVPTAGRAVVGLLLPAGRIPAGGLTDGEVVRIFFAPSAGVAASVGEEQADPVLVSRADVLSSTTDAVSGATSVSVVVSEDEATDLTVQAALGNVAVALVSQQDR